MPISVKTLKTKQAELKKIKNYWILTRIMVTIYNFVNPFAVITKYIMRHVIW